MSPVGTATVCLELNVEKKVGKPGHKVTAAEFRQKCRDYASKQVEAQKADFVRMGVFGDWAHPYLTMDFQFEANIVRTLAKIIDRGHLHRGFKPVHWCLDCGSALAEAEVEYADKQSSAVDVDFPFVDRAEAASRLGCDDGEAIDLAIWTTTPWTLPANRAVALSADLEYVLLDLGSRRVLVAEALAEDCAQRFGAASHEIIGRAKGEALEGLLVMPPFGEAAVPIVLGEHVTTEAGTGCVHTAPAHGLEDFDMGQRYGLEDTTRWRQRRSPPRYAGICRPHIFKANDDIVAALDGKGAALYAPFQHSYPHCWRHKTPIVFRATPQWFVSDGQRRSTAKSGGGRDGYRLEPGAHRQHAGGQPDWSSRQRAGASPLPCLFCTTGEFPRHAVSGRAGGGEDGESGYRHMDDLDPAELLGNDAAHYEKVTDTWMSGRFRGHARVRVAKRGPELAADLLKALINTAAGSGPAADRYWYPHTLYRGFDHGFTVDGDGRKM